MPTYFNWMPHFLTEKEPYVRSFVSFERIHESRFDLILYARCVVFLTKEPKATFSVYTHAKSIKMPALMSLSSVDSWRFYLLSHCMTMVDSWTSEQTDNMQSSWGWQRNRQKKTGERETETEWEKINIRPLRMAYVQRSTLTFSGTRKCQKVSWH